jgi:GTP cyclohydrolase I
MAILLFNEIKRELPIIEIQLAETKTSKMIGVFKDNEITRNEFLSLIK